MQFDLFKLHDQELDIGNQSWICFKGKKIPKIISELRNQIIKDRKLGSTKDLCRLVSNKINSNPWSVEQVLYGHKKWVPIPIIKSLTDLSNNPGFYRKKIVENTFYLKCNSATSKPIIAVKRLNILLCKIAGAHAADGNIYSNLNLEIKNKTRFRSIIKEVNKSCKEVSIINTKGKIRIRAKIKDFKLVPKINREDVTIFIRNQINLTEGSLNAVKAYKKWVFLCFKLDTEVRKHNKKNAWFVDFGNKIICRYLTKFLDFPSGKKTLTVEEPSIIKNSLQRFRKSFLLGFMTFEGHVPPHIKHIECSSKSKMLIKNVRDIFTQLQIPLKVKKDGYDRWVCRSLTLNKKQLMNCMDLFEKNTEKWQRINEKMNGFTTRFRDIKRTKKIFDNAYPPRFNNVGITSLFEEIYNAKKVKHSVLKQKMRIDNSTLTRYLRTLRECHIINSMNGNRVLELNNDKDEWRLPSEIYKNGRL